MADYYNTTRGPLSVTMSDGSSMAIPPKGWVFVAPGQESSASIVRLVKKGYLVRSAVARTTQPSAVSPQAAPSAPVAPKPVQPASAKAEPAAPKAEEAPEKGASSTSGVKEEFVRRKR